MVKLNLNECSLSNHCQMGIKGVIRDHFGTILRAFSKQACMGLGIKAKILKLDNRLLYNHFLYMLEGLLVLLVLNFSR